MTLYYLVFVNSLQSAFILSVRSEYAWAAALGFGGYNMAFATFCALAGSTIGMGINYSIGRYFSRYREEWPGVTSARYARACAFFHRYLVWLLLFAILPLIGMVAVVSGMLRVPPGKAMLLIFIGRVGYYCFHYFYLGR